MARRKRKLSPVYAISIGVHLAVGAALAFIPQEKLREIVAIALNDAEKKQPAPKPPPPPKEHAAKSAGRNSGRPAPVAAAAAAAQGAADAPVFTDIGLALDASSADGLAINIAPQRTVAAAPKAAAPPKILVAHRAEVVCADEIIKARPLTMVKPTYTDRARSAHVQGRVRIQLDVNEAGEVTEARVLTGLGYGLDEAAMTAARRLRFTPATRCGRPVAAPFVIAMRFVLGT